MVFLSINIFALGPVFHRQRVDDQPSPLASAGIARPRQATGERGLWFVLDRSLGLEY
jgi:hypothetical protein